jgi:hypothetical protein
MNTHICLYTIYKQAEIAQSALWRATGKTAGGGIPAGIRNFSPLHSAQTDSEAHPASYLIGTEG